MFGDHSSASEVSKRVLARSKMKPMDFEVSKTASKVKVPMDFGRENIGSPSHDNLVLKVKEGHEVKANSLILSYNSPVIAKLTTELFQTSLDMDDFCEDSVNCFIHAAYTGALEKISRANFREVYKIAHAFEVSWLAERCEKYFDDIVNSLTCDDHEQMLYVVEEGRYANTAIKKQVLLDSVLQKLSSLPEEQKASFLKKYLAKMSTLEKDQLDIVLELARADVIIIVEFIKEYLVTISSGLDANSRYLLENLRLVSRNLKEDLAFNEMFDMLEEKEGMSLADMVLTLQLHRRSTLFCKPISAALSATKPTTITDVKKSSFSFYPAGDASSSNTATGIGFSFGAPAAGAAFGAPAAGAVFGAPAAPGLFGTTCTTPAAGGLFGTPAPANKSGSSLFGGFGFG